MTHPDRRLPKSASKRYEIAYTTLLLALTALLCAPSLAVSAPGETSAQRHAAAIGGHQPADGVAVGPYTGDRLPRFASLKANRVHLRRGPSIDHPIDWVLTRRHMPVLIIAEHDNWRRVRLLDGTGGWIHRSLLTGRRYAAAMRDDTMLREDPKAAAHPVAKAMAGAVLRIDRCEADWCRVEADGHIGWAERRALWGAAETPTR